jgi:pullulanase
MLLYLKHWMHYYRLDGLRVDSVANIANWDFIKAFKDEAHCTWQMRWQEQGHGPVGADERFLMVGEELAVPLDLVRQHRLDSLWNDHFKRILRAVILGKNVADEQSFEGSVRKLIDCRLLGFQDGSQAINYVTSHDVEGFGHERLYSFLINTGVIEAEQRIKLAFVCLLTAVGIPMIFAGEEFGDQHDRQIQGPEKQLDPVNFERRDDPWRLRIFEYVTKLVKLRCEHGALRVNDTDFIHLDFHEGKRVLVWQRGQRENGDVVVVIANFSAYGTPDPLSENAEYVVTNWPALPQGKRWYEVTQDREVPTEWAGREPIFPWEAKVYAAVASVK